MSRGFQPPPQATWRGALLTVKRCLAAGCLDAPTKKASEDVSTLTRCNRSMTGLQALLKVNLRLATTVYLSNAYDSLSSNVTRPVLLFSAVTALSAYEVT